MSGLKTFLSISSFAFLIAAGVLVVVSAGVQPASGDLANRGARTDDGSRLALVTRGSGQKDQDLKLLLALKVLGSGNAPRRNQSDDKDHPRDRGANSSERPGS